MTTFTNTLFQSIPFKIYNLKTNDIYIILHINHYKSYKISYI